MGDCVKLYIINYTDEYQALCALEMKRLFDAPFKDVIVSNCDYDAGRSAFFKAKIDVLAHHHDLQTFLDLVSTVYVEKFKINYIKSKQDDLSYDLRMELVRSCASRMKGIGCIDEEAIQLGVLYHEGIYYLGYLYEDHQTWQKHLKKPQSYSQSISAKDARALVNIACGKNDITLVDPCAGVGSILLEAMQMGIICEGYEINKGVAWKANRNLEYFGYPKVVGNMDMLEVDKHYDSAILDIPYNLYSSITKAQQYQLIKKCYDLADTFVLVSYEPFDDVLEEIGFEIKEKCLIKKIKMHRYVYYCEVKK